MLLLEVVSELVAELVFEKVAGLMLEMMYIAVGSDIHLEHNKRTFTDVLLTVSTNCVILRSSHLVLSSLILAGKDSVMIDPTKPNSLSSQYYCTQFEINWILGLNLIECMHVQ